MRRVALEHAVYLSLVSDAGDYLPILDALEHRSVRCWIEGLSKVSEPEAQLVLPHQAWTGSPRCVESRSRHAGNKHRLARDFT